jgi:hypothetical protein
LNFGDRFLKDTPISIFMKFRPVGVELFHADGQTDERTDMTKLIVTFCNFVNALKKGINWN